MMKIDRYSNKVYADFGGFKSSLIIRMKKNLTESLF